MSNWTRAHDAWIARECEGLEVWVNASDGAICDFQDDSIPHYLTDPAAAIRAAEAWRKKDEDIDRTITITSPITRMGMPCTVDAAENYRVGDGYRWREFEGKASENDVNQYAAAIVQALLRATVGPA